MKDRKNLRLKECDYSSNGAYFLTICTHNRNNFFGDIKDGEMFLSQIGLIAEKHIKILSNTYEDISVEKYAIMPNHIHLIILICRERIVCVPSDCRKSGMLKNIAQKYKLNLNTELISKSKLVE